MQYGAAYRVGHPVKWALVSCETGFGVNTAALKVVGFNIGEKLLEHCIKKPGFLQIQHMAGVWYYE